MTTGNILMDLLIEQKEIAERCIQERTPMSERIEALGITRENFVQFETEMTEAMVIGAQIVGPKAATRGAFFAVLSIGYELHRRQSEQGEDPEPAPSEEEATHETRV